MTRGLLWLEGSLSMALVHAALESTGPEAMILEMNPKHT
jgi:hypothetical protein